MGQCRDFLGDSAEIEARKPRARGLGRLPEPGLGLDWGALVKYHLYPIFSGFKPPILEFRRVQGERKESPLKGSVTQRRSTQNPKLEFGGYVSLSKQIRLTASPLANQPTSPAQPNPPTDQPTDRPNRSQPSEAREGHGLLSVRCPA